MVLRPLRPGLSPCERQRRPYARPVSDELEATSEAPGAGDPRPAAPALRPAGQPSARRPDRRAGPDDPLPEHQRHQPRRGLRAPAGAVRHLGGGSRRARRRGDRGDPARRASRTPRRRGSRRILRRAAATTRTSLAARRAARRGDRVSDLAARGGAQDGRLRPASSPSTVPRSRSTRTSTASVGGWGCSASAPRSRRRTTRCCGWSTPRTPTSSTST